MSMKRFTAILLALCMVLSLMPADVFAAHWPVQMVEYAYYTNPLYHGPELVYNQTAWPADVESHNHEDVHKDLASAAAEMRELLAAREPQIAITIATDEDAYDTLFALYEAALEHTGDPKLGDYLRWNAMGWRGGYYFDYEGTTRLVTFVYDAYYYTTAEQELEMDLAVEALLDTLNLEKQTDFDKVRGVYDWICDNVVYDYENLEDDTYTLKQSAYAALINGTSVCQGYASLLYRLLLELDVDNRVIVGDAGGPHAWNIVKLGGLYYDADSTWDAIYHQAGWEYPYFLVSEAEFADHVREAEYLTPEFMAAYPMSETPYTPNVISGTWGENLQWTLYDGVLTVSGTGALPEYSAPWYEHRDRIMRIVIEEGITSIPRSTFAAYNALERVDLPASVQSIGQPAFEGCRALTGIYVDDSNPYYANDDRGVLFNKDMTRLLRAPGGLRGAYTIPENVEEIDINAFTRCEQLTEISMGDHLHTIGAYAFEFCSSLNKVHLGSGVKKLGNNAFHVCGALETVTGGENLTYIGYEAFNKCASLRSFRISATVETIVSGAFAGCASLTGFDVDSGNANYVCNEQGLLLTKDLTVLVQAPGAISGCLVIPDTVRTIDAKAFQHCKNLPGVVIPGNVKTIANHAFDSCSALVEVFINEGVEVVGYRAFFGCKMQSVILPVSITSVGEEAFISNRNLEWIQFLGNAPEMGASFVDAIPVYYYRDDSTWSDDVISAVPGSMIWTPICRQHNYTHHVVEADCENPGHTVHTCADCGYSYTDGYQEALGHDLQPVVTPGTCMSAGYTDYHCSRCDYAEAGPFGDKDPDNHVGEIGTYCYGCGYYIPATGTIGENIQWILDKNGVLTVSGTGNMGCYEAPWAAYKDQIVKAVILSGVNDVGLAAFSNHTNLQSVDLADTVTTIGPDAFAGCTALRSVKLPAGVTVIGAAAFLNCTALESVILSENLEIIWSHAFNSCTSLKEIVIPAGVREISLGAFSHCSNLETITFLGSAPSFDPEVFYGVTATAYYPGGDASWNEAAMTHYGANITWVAYCAGAHDYEDVVTEATCEDGGYTTHTCKNCGVSYVDSYVDALGHDYTSVITDPTCTEDGYITDTCSRCGKVNVYTGTPAYGHNYDHVVTEPTCQAQGYTTHTCSRCQDSYIDDYVDPVDHSYYYEVTYPDCTEGGYTTFFCTWCDDSYVSNRTDPLGHDCNQWYEISPASCTESGMEASACSRCDHTETREIPALGHHYNSVVTNPSCEEQGYTTHTCVRCDDTYVDTFVDAKGHNYGKWSVTQKATCTTPGSQTHRCNRCKHTETEEIPALGHDMGAWYALEEGVEQRDCSRCDYVETRSVEAENPFSDVDENAYFYNPIMWAIEAGITNGTGPDTFDPENQCTREQIVTFLWRAAGKPEPTITENPFEDVTDASYAYKAILWALENGITSGTTPTTFGLQDYCTREQVATFLWRAAGKPEPSSTENPFTDVSESNFGYYPILWAAENNITSGYGNGLFGLNDTCTRGQIVTFLYRAFAEK